MAIIKCKMCGGDLVIVDGLSVAECEYCGSRQTVPVADNEKKLIQFERAERLRRNCEFDKAAGLYEAIVSEFRQEAEAYWGLVLCKYGIEYVDDPAIGRKIPTCHRSSFDSVMDDSNFDLAMENADEEALRVYRQEAKQIETIRRGILEVSSTEKPYDIFICYKETDSDGNRTLDSLLAQDIYDALNAKGYRVFFSRITLEDKLGQAYEPYIFAALNSAKIMLAVGTCYEHYNAVWVKNEWSRFLKIIAQDKGKYLIPCYKNIDAYDIPREFAHLQGQDMGKVGAMSDLIRGVAKILDTGKQVHPVKETVIVERPSSAAPLLRRAFLFLEDGDWESADEYCEKVLDQDPENALAYVGKLMVQLHVRTQDALKDCKEPFDKQNYYRKAIRFADEQLTAELTGYNFCIRERNETARKTELYLNAVGAMQKADTEETFRKAADQFTPVSGFRDADTLKQQCYEKIAAIQAEKARLEEEKRLAQENQRKTEIYTNAVRRMQLADTEAAYQKVAELFASIPGFRDADALAMQCMGQVAAIQAEKVRAAEEKVRIAAEKKLQQELNRQQAALAKQKRAEELAQARIRKELARNTEIYDNAVKRMETAATEGAYRKAAEAFASIPGFQDADSRAQQCRESITALKEQKKQEAAQRQTAPAEKKGSKNAFLLAGIAAVCALAFLLIPKASSKEEMQLSQPAVAETTAVETTVPAETEAVLTPDQLAYAEAEALAAEEKHSHAGLAFNKLGDYRDSQARSKEEWKKSRKINTVVHGTWHPNQKYILGLRTDGTVASTGNNLYGQCDVSQWKDIVEIYTNGVVSYGLRSDGTVIATKGDKSYYFTGMKYDVREQATVVESWTDIEKLYCASSNVIGLKTDGTVLSANPEYDYSSWSDVVKLSGTDGCVAALRADGTVVSNAGECLPEDGWENIVDVQVYNSHIFGLKNDGTVVISGDISNKGLQISHWEDIALVVFFKGLSVDGKHDRFAVGLKEDGTVVVPDGASYFGTEDWAETVRSWENIKLIVAGDYALYGLKKDGTVVAAGIQNNGDLNVTDWENIVDICVGREFFDGYTIGLKEDGSLIIAQYADIEAENWTDIRIPQSYSSEKDRISRPAEQPEADAGAQQTAYGEAEALLQNGEVARAAIAFGKLGDYSDARQRSFDLWNQVAQRDTIHNNGYTMAIKEDNTLLFSTSIVPGTPSMRKVHDTLLYQSTVVCQKNDLGEIVGVAPGNWHLDVYYLTSDGKVGNFAEMVEFNVPPEWDPNDYCDIHSLENIVAVSAVNCDRARGLLGLKCDGTVAFASWSDYSAPFDVQSWEDIIAVTAVGAQVFGLQTDGTVVTSGIVNPRKDLVIDVSDWKDIIAINGCSNHIIGLKSDGTVIAAGDNDYGECDVSAWTDIIAIDTDYYNTLGLKSDGTVVAVGFNNPGICNVEDWTDIVAISAGNPTIGLKQDGTVIALSYDRETSRKRISTWTDIKIPTNTRYQIHNDANH